MKRTHCITKLTNRSPNSWTDQKPNSTIHNTSNIYTHKLQLNDHNKKWKPHHRSDYLETETEKLDLNPWGKIMSPHCFLWKYRCSSIYWTLSYWNDRGSPNNIASNFPEVYESPIHKRQQSPAFSLQVCSRKTSKILTEAPNFRNLHLESTFHKPQYRQHI